MENIKKVNSCLKKSKGFSLIELLVVVGIIGMLAADSVYLLYKAHTNFSKMLELLKQWAKILAKMVRMNQLVY